MSKTKEQINEIVKKIIEASKGNNSGCPFSKKSILSIVNSCDGSTEVLEIERLMEVVSEKSQGKRNYLLHPGDIYLAIKGKEQETIHRKIIHTWLPVKFTDEQMREMSLKLAQKNGEVTLTELNKKSAASQFKSEIDKLQAEIADLGEKVILGEFTDNVECVVVYDYQKNKKTTCRNDTNEIIKEGEIPEHERQVELFDQAGNKINRETEVPGYYTGEVDNKEVEKTDPAGPEPLPEEPGDIVDWDIEISEKVEEKKPPKVK